MWADLRCGSRPKTLRVCASIPPEMRKGILRLLYLSICVVCMHALYRLCVPHTAGLCFASKDSIPSMSSCDSRRGRLRTGCSSQTKQTKPFPDARSCSVDAPSKGLQPPNGAAGSGAAPQGSSAGGASWGQDDTSRGSASVRMWAGVCSLGMPWSSFALLS